MTSFVHVEQPTSHPGVTRAEAVFDHLRAARRGFDGARGLAVLFLAAIVSSLLVIADKLVSSWNDGGVVTAWVALWVVAFVSLAFLSGTTRSLGARAVVGLRNASRRRAAARADEQFMAYAKFDPRILRDLQTISTRQEASAVSSPVVAKQLALDLVAKRSADAQIPTLYEALRRVNLGKYY